MTATAVPLHFQRRTWPEPVSSPACAISCYPVTVSSEPSRKVIRPVVVLTVRKPRGPGSFSVTEGVCRNMPRESQARCVSPPMGAAEIGFRGLGDFSVSTGASQRPGEVGESRDSK